MSLFKDGKERIKTSDGMKRWKSKIAALLLKMRYEFGSIKIS
jgi:hypothetical protein